MWKSPAVQLPSDEKMAELCNQLNMDLSLEERQQIKGVWKGVVDSYTHLDQLPEVLPAVKYPRQTGYRPANAENPYNAWYWKSEIHGAKSGPLLGKRFAIKDNIFVAGVPLMNGCRLVEGFVPAYDATVVTRILDAGGVILGKSSTEDLCCASSSWTNALGPIRNPHDPTRSAGGSSGGSAVLLCTNEVDMALGGDQGGSVRIPASWCGVVGLKATYGLIPYTGAMSIEPTLDNIGPMARTVTECALLLETLAGYDNGLDFRQQPLSSLPEYSKLLNEQTSFKIGVLKEGFDVSSDDVSKFVKEAIEKFSSANCTVETVSVPEHIDAGHILTPLLAEGLYTTMFQNRNVGMPARGLYPTALMDFTGRSFHCNADNLQPVVKIFGLLGCYVKNKYNGRYYGKAQNLMRWLRQKYDELLNKYDVLVMPTLPHMQPVLPKGEVSLTDFLGEAVGHIVTNVAPFNLTGHPALTVNAGNLNNLPVGLQIVGRYHDELTVLQVGRLYEQIRDSK